MRHNPHSEESMDSQRNSDRKKKLTIIQYEKCYYEGRFEVLGKHE